MNRREQTENRARWQAWVEEQEKSGQTQAEFCKQHHLSVVKFAYYRKLSKTKDKTVSHEKAFSPIQIKRQEMPASPEIRIVLQNGFQCFIPIFIEPIQMKRFLEVLFSC
jgi:hypothetical protein